MPELGEVSDVATISATRAILLRTNTDLGVVRMKSIHCDMVFNPHATASTAVLVVATIHRVQNDLGDSSLTRGEGTRVKHEVLAIGRNTDRYYRMWVQAINLEFGYKLVLVITPINITGGDPTFGLMAKWWELKPD